MHSSNLLESIWAFVFASGSYLTADLKTELEPVCLRVILLGIVRIYIVGEGLFVSADTTSVTVGINAYESVP